MSCVVWASLWNEVASAGPVPWSGEPPPGRAAPCARGRRGRADERSPFEAAAIRAAGRYLFV